MKKGTTLRSNIEKTYGAGPKQYQQGWTEFYKLRFKLTPDVLIPRPETELLVDEVIKVVNSELLNHIPSTINILDIGTGSGCIAISVAKNLPNAKVIATDISPEALKVAEQNAKFHQVEDQIIFIESDLLSFVATTNSQPPTIMVANLPYIPTARLLLIDPLVSQFEPTLALDGGQDGFELYRQLFQQMTAKKYLPKIFIAEIDDSQAEIALAEVKKYFPQSSAQVKKDLSLRDRILIFQP